MYFGPRCEKSQDLGNCGPTFAFFDRTSLTLVLEFQLLTLTLKNCTSTAPQRDKPLYVQPFCSARGGSSLVDSEGPSNAPEAERCHSTQQLGGPELGCLALPNQLCTRSRSGYVRAHVPSLVPRRSRHELHALARRAHRGARARAAPAWRAREERRGDARLRPHERSSPCSSASRTIQRSATWVRPSQSFVILVMVTRDVAPRHSLRRRGSTPALCSAMSTLGLTDSDNRPEPMRGLDRALEARPSATRNRKPPDIDRLRCPRRPASARRCARYHFR